jgi:cytidylate kinase
MDPLFMIITIDGPAGSGKSTVARKLADKLAVRFLDTGAMYRAIALAVLNARVQPEDAQAVASIARDCRIDLPRDGIELNGVNVTAAIREPEVTTVASIVAANPAVRTRLVAMQQAIGAAGSIVTEGRDQGTVVFPEAPHKFFLTASLDARAVRRQAELQRKSLSQPLHEVMEQIRLRDERDEQRETAPMIPAADAVIVDTSAMSIDEVVQVLYQRIHEAAAGGQSSC